MHLDCPECKTKFLLDPAALGDAGKKVRCGNCSNVWFQAPPPKEVQQQVEEVKKEQEENLKKAVADQANGIEPSLPAIIIARPAPKWLKTAAMVLFVMNLLLFVMFNREMIGQTSFYDMIGQYTTKGVKIVSAQIVDIKKTPTKNIYTVNWEIKNTNAYKVRMPARRIEMQNGKGEEVAKTSIIKSTQTLNKDELFVIKTNQIEDNTKLGKYIVLDIGSPSELAVR